MFDSEYSRYDGLGLAELIERGDVAASEVLDQALERADRVNPALGALIYDMRDEARRYLRHELVPGAPFAGAPYVLKDIRSMYAGTPTTAGSRFFAEGTADHDSEVVARLRRAGMAVFAKTNTPELGLNQATEPALYGPTRNPWDLSLIPGGSSGGSAAAVAGGIVPWADASDGGGSIRIPASCCGLFGLKPTRGRTPSGPKAGEGWDGLTTQLTVTRTVRDTAAILDVIAGPDTGAPYYAATDDGSYLEDANRDPGKLRIAFTTSALSDVPIDEGWVQATRATATLLEELGHAVEEAWPRYDWQAMDRAYRTVVDVNLAATIAIRSARLGREPAPDALEPCTRSRVEFGRAVSGPTYAHALGTLLRVGRQVGSFFKNLDFNCVQSWWPHYIGFDRSCVPDPYDVEAGLALLAQAGFANPADLVITMDLTEHPTQTYNDDVALAVAQQWQAAGVTVETQVTDYETFEGSTGGKTATEAFVYPPLPVSDACFFLGFISRSTDRLSYTGESTKLDQLITDCRAAVLPADKEALASELFEFMDSRQLGIPVLYIDQVTAFVENLVWDGNAVAPFLHAFDSIRFE